MMQVEWHLPGHSDKSQERKLAAAADGFSATVKYSLVSPPSPELIPYADMLVISSALTVKCN